MRRKRTKTVVINRRDRELFSYLYEVKVATAFQIKRDIFKDVGKAVVYRRLKKLIHMKIIKRCPWFDGKRLISGYSLSKKGLRKFIFNKEDEDCIKRSLSDSIEHDIILNDIRHLLLNCNEIKDYFSENVLNSDASFITGKEYGPFRTLRSDGLILMQKQDTIYHIAVEYEHTLKYTNRYNSLFYNYHCENKIDGVLYICRNKNILKRIIEAEKNCIKENRTLFYYTTLNDLFSNPKCLTFTSCAGNRIVKIS